MILKIKERSNSTSSLEMSKFMYGIGAITVSAIAANYGLSRVSFKKRAEICKLEASGLIPVSISEKKIYAFYGLNKKSGIPELSFPTGKVEWQDLSRRPEQTAANCALRETFEETGFKLQSKFLKSPVQTGAGLTDTKQPVYWFTYCDDHFGDLSSIPYAADSTYKFKQGEFSKVVVIDKIQFNDKTMIYEGVFTQFMLEDGLARFEDVPVTVPFRKFISKSMPAIKESLSNHIVLVRYFD